MCPIEKEMETPLLQTKLYIPPIRPELVPRSRLIERLNDGLQRKLTLVSAPAGFGKTTLVSDWLRHLDIPAAWFSLDEADNDPVRFLIYYVAALHTIEVQQTPASKIGEEVLGMLQSPQPPPTEAILTTLLNQIAALPVRIVLILDDYHLIEAQPIHDALNFLLEHLPPHTGPGGQRQGMHLVIATREDPPLSLARLRARGELIELRAADLRFTSAETAEFLNQMMGLNLSAKDIAALETRTEGWVAGLQLAAFSMQGHKNATSLIKSFTGSHRFVLDYLIEEVLDQQPEDIQTFLLQTAILDRLTGSLCDAVCAVETATGQGNGQQTLEMLEQANLFIVPLDNERHWYRYHHLFADLLLQRLHQTQPEQLPVLYHRASVWYKQNGFVNEAINYALRSKNFERAADMIEDQFGDNYERVSQTILQRWLAEMPEKFVLSKPQLCILQAWTFFTTGQLDAADQRLRATEKMLDPSTDQAFVASLDEASSSERQLPDTNRMRLIGRVAAIRSFLVSFSGDIPGTIRYARQALEYLPEQDLQWRSTVLVALGDAYANQGQMEAAHKARLDALATGKASGDPYLLMIVNLRLAEILRQQGKLHQVIDICERQVKSADEHGISEWPIAGWLFGIWGEVLAELNDLDRATDQAKKGVKLTARGRDLLYEVMSNLCLVRVLFSCGELNGAGDVIQAMEKTAQEHDMPLWASLQLSAWQARIWLAQGKLELASQWAGERELDPEGELTYLHEVEYIAFACILIAQKRLDEATTLLHRLLEAAKAGGRTSRVIEILILQTLAAHSGGDTTQAMSTLEQALTLAEPGGFIRIFVDEGPSMARLLHEALSRGIAPDYACLLLAAFPATEPKQTDPLKAQVPKSDLIEPLSERELEVLQLIAEGLTNQEIANRLFLSLNTVKVHTRNIYGKLDAHHRTEAVAKARALGILHPT
jgi:LuxR family maltose regulon positive regulatory protein